jgi:hypothetical protein
MTNGGISYRDYWVSSHEKERVELRTILDELSPFRDNHWEINRSPDGTADRYLWNALQVLFSGQDTQLANEFLDTSLRVIERTMQERKLDRPECEGGRPRNYGRLLRTNVYVKALLGGPFDRTQALEAAGHYADWCKAVRKSSWDSQDQAYYLIAVRLSLLAGACDQASGLLKAGKKLKWHEKEASLLKALLERSKIQEFSGDKQKQDFLAFLDEVRNPHYKPGVFLEHVIYPFEIAMVYTMYYEGDGRSPDLQRAIELVSR